MSKKIHYTIFAVLLMVGMFFNLVAPATALAKGPELQASITVDPAVLTEMKANGSASYWIDFTADADLSAAYDMGWTERGWYVYNSLTANAKESQANVAAYLTGANVEYQSYWIKNTILVKSSNLNTLNGLLNFPEIKAINPRQTFILYEPDTTAAVIDNGVNSIEPNLTHINADDVWGLGYTGAGLVIANIDTGVRYSHQALVNQYRGNMGGGSFNHNYNWFNPDNLSDNTPRDGHGHGTHTMGTMVGDDSGSNQIGIAPGAEWIACAGCPDGGCTDSALLGCGQFMAAPTDLTGANANPDMRPIAVNNSWGDCGQTYDDWYAGPINAWLAAGVYPVFSNGNSSNCGYSSPPTLNTVGNPARSGNVTGVGSSGEQNGQYANHSNWGPTDNLDTVNPTGGFDMMKPQVLAPGVSIRSSTPGSDSEYQDGWTGTSMSAPHVTGLVALVWQAAPCLVGNYAITENLIEETAVDMVYEDGSPLTPTNFPNFATGWGEIDALAAVVEAAGLCGNNTLTGTVTNVDTSDPLAGVKVEITGTDPANDRTVYTNASGVYSANVGADTFDIAVTMFGYEGDSVTGVVVADGATVVVDFQLAELTTSLVSGTVYDGGVLGLGSHGYPLYAALTFAAPGFNQTIYNDPFTGEYEIELYLDQEYDVTVAAVPGGYDPFIGTYTPDADPDTQDYYLYVPEESCAAPGYAPEYEYFWHFESDDGGFTSGGENSSWAWGDFTSGPGEGHSGTKGIATNPAGDYNIEEDSWMTSPVIDLSGFGTDTPAIQWWEWLYTESATSFWDYARLDVTKDGGVTWLPVWGPTVRNDTGYHQQTVVLDRTYNVTNFQFRFFFHSDSSYIKNGWYVDDIGLIEITTPPSTTVYSSNFDADNGGFVASGTTSWAWGAPSATPGPGAPYSAPNVWATNLTENYSGSENGWITSPVIDLSAFTDLVPTISFWHWNDIENISYDWGAVEATKDGGVTWMDVSGKIGDVSLWTLKNIPLDSSYAVANFQFRFFFRSDYSYNYAGWYIDDVAVTVAEPMVIASPCVPLAGGVVTGSVYDDNTQEVLIGADVVSPGLETQTFALEGDPLHAGLYWGFQPTTVDPEDVDFTASHVKYMDASETISVVVDAVIQQDFYLPAGLLSFEPTTLEHTMMMGDAPENVTLTLNNNGLADAAFEWIEKDRGFVPPLSIPAFTGKLIEDPRPVSMGRAPEAAAVPTLSTSGLFNDLLAGEPAFAVDLNTNELVHIPDTTAPGVWNIIGATMTSLFSGDFIGGDFSTLYAISYDNNNLYTVDTATGAYTLVGAAVSPGGNWTGLSGTPDGTLYGLTSVCNTSTNLVTMDPATAAVTDLGSLPGITCGIDLAYNTNDDMIYIVDIVSDNLFKVDPATMITTLIGTTGISANYAQGMDYEEETGVLYWAAFNYDTNAGELRVIDTTTGASALVGAFPGGVEVDSFAFATGGTADVPWLFEDPASGTVPAEDDLIVDVFFNPTGGGLSQPGDYLAELKINHDTPYTYANIPVTLHLLAPEYYGTFNGTVYGLEACDVNPTALAGATVNFWQEDVLVATTTTLGNGNYNYSLSEGTYDIEILMDGFIDQIAYNFPVEGGETVTVDFELRLDMPCLSVDPASLEQWLMVDRTADQTLTLVNNGAGEAVFEIIEMAVAGIQETVELVLDDGTRDNNIGIGGTWEMIWVNRFTPDPDAYPFNLEQVQIWFSSVGEVYVGDDIIIVVYENTTGNIDPAVGSNWLYSYPTTVQALDTWSVYDLPEVVELNGPGDVVIGVIALEVPGGSYWPASIDQTTTQQRSWAGWWLSSPPPNPPVLPPDDTWILIDDYFPGNWMVRGYGETAAEDIVWLSEDPISGTVPGDSAVDVTVTFDSTGLALGDYFAKLWLKNPPAPAIKVPVTLHVMETITRYLWLPIILK